MKAQNDTPVVLVGDFDVDVSRPRPTRLQSSVDEWLGLVKAVAKAVICLRC